MSDGQETPSASASANRPRTRQRVYKQPPALPVPHIEEDAAERKRVLNVLAQRRYSMYLHDESAEPLVLTTYQGRGSG